MRPLPIALIAAGVVCLVAASFVGKLLGKPPEQTEEQMAEVDTIAADMHSADVAETPEAREKLKQAKVKLQEYKAAEEEAIQNAAKRQKTTSLALRIVGVVLALAGGGLYFASQD